MSYRTQWNDEVILTVEVDGVGTAFDIGSNPVFPNKYLHVGGLPQGGIRNEAMGRLKNNGLPTEPNFYGCLHSMTIETVDKYNNRQVSN